MKRILGITTGCLLIGLGLLILYQLSFPIVEFAVSGKTYRFQGGAPSLPGDPYSQGQELPIRYRSDDPSKAMLDTASEEWGIMIMMFFLGLGFCLAGYGLLRWSKTKKNITQ